MRKDPLIVGNTISDYFQIESTVVVVVVVVVFGSQWAGD